jgi:hypothetical protein
VPPPPPETTYTASPVSSDIRITRLAPRFTVRALSPCQTLLNILAGRVSGGGHTSGTMRLSGCQVSESLSETGLRELRAPSIQGVLLTPWASCYPFHSASNLGLVLQYYRGS